MARIILLGSSGFIGQRVHQLLEGHELRCPARCHLNADTSQDTSHSYPLSGTLERVLHAWQPHALVNCVGCIDGSESELYRVNTDLVRQLISAITRASPQTRLIQLGSAAEYGSPEAGRVISESDPGQPSSAYGASKLAATSLLAQVRADGRMRSTVLRIFNPVGAGMNPNSVLGRTASLLREAHASGSDALQLGPLDAWRDFVAVNDVAAAIVAAVERPDCDEFIINLARGEAVQVRSLVHMLARHAGFTGVIREDASGSPRSGAVSWQQASVQLAAAALDWHALEPLDRAVQSVWRGATMPTAAPA